MLNTKNIYILPNASNHTVDVLTSNIPTMEVNGGQQLSSYQHSSKYLLLCSTEERR